MQDKIKEFAQEKAGLTNEQFEKVLKHDATCRCALCARFDNYLRIKGIVATWENSRTS